MVGTNIGRSLLDALRTFETVGMPARNFAVRTRREYSRDLRELIEYLATAGITDVEAVRLPHLEGYLAELDWRGLQGSSRNRKTHTIKSFFKWLVHHDLLITNPSIHLIPPRAIKKEPRFLSEEEYKRLLRACSHHPRDAAMIEVFLQTGMRLSELANLTLKDVELPKRITRDIDSMGRVRVQRKGGKIEHIPLNYKACHALATYLKVRPKVEHTGVLATCVIHSCNRAISRHNEGPTILHLVLHELDETSSQNRAIPGSDGR